MKKSILITTMLCSGLQLSAQLYVAPGTDFHIEPGTALAIDSLTIVPSKVFDLNGQTIGKSYVPLVSASGKAGIDRVYSFTPALALNGNIGITYSDGELNGNAEASLNLAYTNGGPLNISTGSKVSLPLNKITKKLNATISELTAAEQPGSCTKPPTSPGNIVQTPAAKPCPGEVRTYSVSASAGAGSYNWAAPSGASILSGQGTTEITIAFGPGFTGGSPVTVYAVNDCGASSTKSKTISFGPKPKAPVMLTSDLAGLCGMTNITYAVVNEGYDYTWSFDIPQATVASGQGTSSITADFGTGFSQAKLSVTATNGCGTGPAKVQSGIKALPGKPSPIAGATVVCPLQSGVGYSIAPIPHAVSYTWTSPTGSVISDGTTTSITNSLTTSSNSVTVNYGSKSGQIKVKANNSCGSGTVVALSVSANCTGSRDELQTLAVKVYPNPAKEVIHFDFASESEGSYALSVIDVLGREVIGREESVAEGNNSVSIDVSSLVPGTYQLIMRPLEVRDVLKMYQASFVIQ